MNPRTTTPPDTAAGASTDPAAGATTAAPAGPAAPAGRAPGAPATATTGRHRIPSLDIIRGAVMVLMAVDHVRVYFSSASFSPTDLSQTTTGLFLTRWVTHFCAPAFVFLAGTGAYLYARRLEARSADAAAARAPVSRLLLVRGAWLILIELTVLRLAWTFNLAYDEFAMAGILWVIGAAMIALAALVRLPTPAVAAFGAVVVLGHNVMDFLTPAVAQGLQGSPLAWLWQVLYFGGGIRPAGGGPVFFVLYSLVPWVGVMALGYAFGAIVALPPERRRRACLAVGAAAVAAFLALRGLNLYGDPTPWAPRDSAAFTVLSFLNTQKYPASLLFLLMTLGPTIALVPLLERARGPVADTLALFGRVPFFFYVLHVPLIHAMAVATAAAARHDDALAWLFLNHPILIPPPPDGWGFSPLGIWLTTALACAILYLPCRWFAAVKAGRREWWLKLL